MKPAYLNNLASAVNRERWWECFSTLAYKPTEALLQGRAQNLHGAGNRLWSNRPAASSMSKGQIRSVRIDRNIGTGRRRIMNPRESHQSRQ
jgi:hypothetical protein